MTNWRLQHGDPLGDLVSKNSDAIDLARLYEGTTHRSRMGAVRKKWREHLGIDDDALARLVRTLVIAETPESLEALRARLDDRFLAVGMRRIPHDRAGHVYDGLPGQLQGQGRVEFDRISFLEMCRREGLLEKAEPEAQMLTVGVRSFMHPIDDIEARCDRVLNLVPYFDGRYIRREADWAQLIHPTLQRFLVEAAREAEGVRLVLDAHASLAFAAGAVLNVKSGRCVEVEQRTDGRRFWHAADVPDDPAWNDWEFDIETKADPIGGELALAVSLTHDVGEAVRAHLSSSAHRVRTLVHARPAGGPSQRAVACGRHAWKLAERLVSRTRPLSEPAGSSRHAHLFFAGPNTLAFFLGQLHQALGPTTVYEWDFEGLGGGGYRPGITVA
ncbi:SAVED domain-containing protein [Leptolyngbya sp. 15MV]|nr:SAVED domain-containing protein [Leptolyngbya sp. 15MV]